MKPLFASLFTLAMPAMTFAVIKEADIAKDVEHGESASPFAGTIYQGIAALIAFVVTFVILKKIAWGPILKALNDREAKIRKDLEDAEDARNAADAKLKEIEARLNKASDEAREIVSRAAADAEKVATGIRMQSQQEAEEAKERAVKDIEAARKDAVREVYEQAAGLATSVAEKILRRNLNANDQRDLVEASLNQLQDVAKN
jgi:F-type H+-transporting ATPase subunit b